MSNKKNIFAIIGSASRSSANQKLLYNFASLTQNDFNWTIFNGLKTLPHFDPELSIDNPHKEVINFRNEIIKADGILICTPEYVYSIPSGLKNAIEWCVSTTIFSGKPTGIITASAGGQKGHVELQFIMETLMAKLSSKTTLLISGIKGKINDQGEVIDPQTTKELMKFANSFKEILNNGLITNR